MSSKWLEGTASKGLPTRFFPQPLCHLFQKRDTRDLLGEHTITVVVVMNYGLNGREKKE
jgi:hypothetical protein